ncbi:glycoside hydrolase family 37 protein [Leucosporidium creatinivorum]|uniref:Trehalase n=1 Tax=Leucosporidium creatinivorum TaxID=106004 RepID=A0A1Y2G1K9_9BASI|nr:glycoside hydrolase family 37 protein [Leucosporidium creatinivorum]
MSRVIDIPPPGAPPPEVAVFSPTSHSLTDDESDLRLRGAQEDASILYSRPQARRNKTRTFSESGGFAAIAKQRNVYADDSTPRSRRMSHDEASQKPRRFLVDVEETMKLVLEQEDTDGNFQIAATDKGPKVFSLGTASSNGYNSFDIRGTYMLSNLLQELALARDHGQKSIVLDEARLSENPVSRLSRMIRHSFWSNLTRRIDGDGLEAICADPKNRNKNQAPRVYVPEAEPGMKKYYERIAKLKPHLGLIVDTVPTNFTAEWVKSRNEQPGILALAMKEIKKEGEDSDFEGIPFVVPGARFNELYNWDSYFISLGLLADGNVDLAKGIVEHFLFEIKHYGKILNGNRSYYLCRSQPPFLTDLILQVFAQLDPANAEENKAWLKRAIQGAIKEYHTVWQDPRRLDEVTGLSRYRPDGLGIPPETEASHFTAVLQPYADELGISVNEFNEKYNAGEVNVPKLDEYFLHDRGVRESGHDTTYRFEKRCANLGTIDLCSLLYKYEVDIATVIKEHFDDSLELVEDYEISVFPFGTEIKYTGPADFSTGERGTNSSLGKVQTSAEWTARADRRKALADYYLWHEGRGIYTDWDCAKSKQSLYDSVTTFWPLWAGMASEAQAEKVTQRGLHLFEVAGGLVSGTDSSRGRVSLQRPNRQWDYPAAWPPHQIMAWGGLQKYGHHHEAQRVAYRWLYMVTCGFVEAGGCVPEKFNAVESSSNIDAEYGNQGTDFTLIPREGFGWTNASYQLGLEVITQFQRRALGALTPPDSFFYGPKRGQQQPPV